MECGGGVVVALVRCETRVESGAAGRAGGLIESDDEWGAALADAEGDMS